MAAESLRQCPRPLRTPTVSFLQSGATDNTILAIEMLQAQYDSAAHLCKSSPPPIKVLATNPEGCWRSLGPSLVQPCAPKPQPKQKYQQHQLTAIVTLFYKEDQRVNTEKFPAGEPYYCVIDIICPVDRATAWFPPPTLNRDQPPRG